uniref:Calcium channel, voltage-dependent, alpha 2/delta subunit 4a n=1 Tax=Poecilia reticulata TaxID=8081 RepID=A0A3P9N9R2_POERE
MCKTNPHSVSSARPLLSSFYALASTFKWFLSNVLLQPCDTEYPSFIYEPSVKETNSIIKCGRCQRMFVVQQIPESNLLMLVVQGDCDCSRQYPPITLVPKEVKTLHITHQLSATGCGPRRSGGVPSPATPTTH